MDMCNYLYVPHLESLRILRTRRHTLEQDLEEQREEMRLNVLLSREKTTRFLGSAYNGIMTQRKAAFRLSAPKIDQKFKNAVIDYLGAKDTKIRESRQCNIIGMCMVEDIKAAQLVLEDLGGDELAMLFGGEELVLSDPRNSIALYRNFKEAFDEGTIVIVPISPAAEHTTVRWACALVDESKRKHMALCHSGCILRWGDLDGRELNFFSNTRPGRRFLYFRFILAYLLAKRHRHVEFVHKVDRGEISWEIPGRYLNKSLLRAVGQNVSGTPLPPSIYEDYTFESDEKFGNADLILAARIRAFDLYTIKEAERKSKLDTWSSSDEEDSDEEEEE
ncbi:hypothetical protein AJ80_08427 [Polytolypa hystricis UAMH7299]|uniref:HNH nuclease domain-containing protein n=1 Tax=Polytolypa hystricis (strain UAMH7299) TaxID=1447883 RepID=A0A2B7X800_POLH7|nr:hypothetical protein AJ80_08427 [Polytolypa hystricis UAMH7299]